MQNLNTIPTTGTFQNVADCANNNFLALQTAVNQLELAAIRSKGFFASADALETAYPSPVVGDWAAVASGNTAYIYRCSTAGTWTNTGEEWLGGDMTVIEQMIDDKIDEAIGESGLEGGFYY
jgi:hypothetical protein